MVILKTYFYPLLFVSLFFICEQKLKHIEWLWLHINKKNNLVMLLIHWSHAWMDTLHLLMLFLSQSLDK